MQQETYAVIEISKKYIKFAVGKYKEKIGLKVVFKEREKNKASWLDENNEIIDTNVVSHRLTKMINKYESIFREKIQRVSVVYPTGTLEIKDASPSLFIDNPDKLILKSHIDELHKMAKRVNYDDKKIVTNLKPYEYRINNIHSVAKPPINAHGNMVSLNAKVYTAERKVVDSFKKVLQNLNLEINTMTSQMFALAKQCSEGLNFRETFVMVNWDWECIDLGFFSRETLVKKQTIGFGIKHIIENLAAKMSAKFDTADKYIFKLLNFSSSTLDESVIYRKYNTQEKRTLELKAIEIKEMLFEELKGIIDKSDILISREMENVRSFKVYHIGKITEIAGFEKILLRSNYKNISEIYYSLVTGASEIWTHSLCGSIRHAREVNKNSKEIKTSTGVYPNPALVRVNQVQHQPRMQNSPLQHNRPMMQQQSGFTQQSRPMIQQQFMMQNQRVQPQMVGQQNYQNNENYLKNGIINTQRNK
ncbi:DUF1720 domain-containing protein [Spiroplasma monobiae]|nr:DUF1720 domain-containing protein [Spiroplasma monobiae]